MYNDKYTSMCGSNFYETDINKLEQLEFKLLGFRNMQEKLGHIFYPIFDTKKISPN